MGLDRVEGGFEVVALAAVVLRFGVSAQHEDEPRADVHRSIDILETLDVLRHGGAPQALRWAGTVEFEASDFSSD